MGKLFVVATPIGNMEDITLRAIRILREVSLIAAEDTRKTGRLLAHHGIETPMVSCFEYNELARIGQLLLRLARQDVALVSDAGTPGVSDPGYRLITAAIRAGMEVVPVPGASAVTAALAVSGLPTDRALYLGFLPRKAGARRQFLSEVATQPYTLIAFEAPHRLLRSLADIQEMMGDRRLVVARELTKLHEEILRGTVSELTAHFAEDSPRGELTLVIEGAQDEDTRWPESRVRQALLELLEKGMRRKDAARQLASESGWSTRDIYELREATDQ